MHAYHRGIGVVSTEISKPLQSLSPQTNPWLQKRLHNVLHITLAEIQSWGQSHEEGGETLLTDDNQK